MNNKKFDEILKQTKDKCNNIETSNIFSNCEKDITPLIKVKHNWLYNLEEFLFTYRFHLFIAVICLCIIVGILKVIFN